MDEREALQAAAAALEGMSEDELLRRARKAMSRAIAAGRGTAGWSVQWAVYDAYSAELERRAVAYAASLGREGRW